MPESDWHLQVCEREWVVWGYGSREDGAEHIEPAETVIGGKDWETRLPFKLPKVEEWSKNCPPQEIRRVTCWGWRIRSNCMTVDIGWRLCKTKEQCAIDAGIWLSNETPKERDQLSCALDDIREYGRGLW